MNVEQEHPIDRGLLSRIIGIKVYKFNADGVDAESYFKTTGMFELWESDEEGYCSIYYDETTRIKQVDCFNKLKQLWYLLTDEVLILSDSPQDIEIIHD